MQALARGIAEAGRGEHAHVFRLGGWSERMLDWALTHPDFKTQLFRLVDVFPACTDDADVLRHVDEYFEGIPVPRALDLGVELAEHVPFGAQVTAAVVRRNIRRMARQFIAGETPGAAVPRLTRLWRRGQASTVDLLGEHTVTEAEADHYARRVRELLDTLVAATRRLARAAAPRARPVGRPPPRRRLGEALGPVAAVPTAHRRRGHRGGTRTPRPRRASAPA